MIDRGDRFTRRLSLRLPDDLYRRQQRKATRRTYRS
jgi:hypothetical protein